MNLSVFYEMKFILLVLFSLVIPVGIYIFLNKKFSISSWAVAAFALLLVVVAGIDVVLLESLEEMAKTTGSPLHNKIFSGQLSLALYLFPALFAGLGVNLLTHVLVGHLNEAESEFDKEKRNSRRHGSDRLPDWPRAAGNSASRSEWFYLIGSAVTIAVIFALDIFSGADIRLHVLYIFPLAIVARHCAKLRVTIVAIFVTTIFQVVTFAKGVIGVRSFVTDIGVAFAASLLIVILARSARNKHLVIIAQAATDPLTNLANRRAFLADVESEITRQKRYGGTFSLAMLDLDGFKALNDSKGHRAGDEALMLAANVLRDCTRESDSVGRIGGDEFAVLIPSTQDVDCSFMFQKLCDTIAQRMAAAGFAITASIGCKTFMAPPESTTHALQQADEIMYEAKNRGKNCAVHS